jgi:Zn-dependent protease with chaperone function
VTTYTVSGEQYRRAVEYSHAKYRHYFIGAVYGFATLLLVLFLRLGAKFRDWAEKASRHRIVQLVIYAPLMLLTITLLGLPTDTWDHRLERTYGLSVQGWGSWGADWIKNLLIALVLGTVLVWILYGVIRRSPRRWWFYFWLASLPVVALVFYLAPVVIEPMFFQFKPLDAGHPQLVSEIQKVAERGGIHIARERMFEMNASSKLTSQDAFVTGFGASKRVVVWDTTLAKATISETLFVFGHEMGHYVLLHIPKGLSIVAVLALVLFYLAYSCAGWIFKRWGERWAIRSLDDWASLPMLLLLISCLSFLAAPIGNSISRYFEHEADRYGLEVIHGIVPDSSQIAARYFLKSGETNLADPNPSEFIKIWFFDHPSRSERVDFAATYDPWSRGKTPRYVK